jgi:hypothetical protein
LSTSSQDDFSERNHDAKALFLQQYEYAASDDIANAWLQQYQQEQERQYQEQQERQGAGHDFSSVSSLPDNVTFPSTDTADTTQAMSAQDDTADAVVSPLNTSTATTKGLVRLEEHLLQTTPLPLLAAVTPPPPSNTTKPVLVRLASRNAYDGEGMEVTELEDKEDDPMQQYHQQQQRNDPMYMSMISMDNSIRTCSSWEDQSVRHPEIFRGLQRSLSDEDMTNLFLGTNGK